jgi:cell fate (sporulation/competence/biofilm development) regulator YlbF (YheA/YmcA/DUF963 family)
MTSLEETATITRALLALLDAVNELDGALLELPEIQDHQPVVDHIKASHEARKQCLEQIKVLVSLMEKNREQR